MQQAVLRSIDDGLSGAVLHLGDRDRVVAEHAYGHQRQWDRTERMLVPELMRPDTMFDLASLTKMFSTVLALHRLVDVRTLSIDDPVARYLPGFDTPDKRSIRLRDLLGHNSGLPSGFHFYDPARAGALFSQDRALTLRLLPQVPLIAPPRTATLYSDLNFVALGAVIEQVTGERQDDFVASRLYAPMGLRRTGYRPLARGFAKGTASRRSVAAIRGTVG
ncbi:serine hydrolase [Roseateles chitinivorans]|uniref:serine hydrolase n=1 Tax=Roseateles chitinivorans TaxID=2917965 RepID=UPI003D669E9D